MTKDEEKIIRLEYLLKESHHTISYLHNCLIFPNNYIYIYPDQTLNRLKQIEEVVKIERGCCHSGPNPDCPICIKKINELEINE